MKKLTIAIIALSFAFPVLAQEAPASVTHEPRFNSAPTEVTNNDAPQAPESPRSGGGGGSNQKAQLKAKIALLEQIVALLQTLIQLKG